MVTIKIYKDSFCMRNYYNNPTSQLPKMSILFICNYRIFYCKSRNVYYYFHFIFVPFSILRGKANIKIEYIETKWYVKPTKFGYYRVVKKYRILYSRGWSKPDLRSIYRFGTPKFGRPNSSKVDKEKVKFFKKQIQATICNSF